MIQIKLSQAPEGFTPKVEKIIEAAYLSGFEPSSDCLPVERLYQEAERYLCYLALATA